MRPIRKGVRVCEYDGRRMSKSVADVRYEGRPVTYLFHCGDNTVIDGFGMAMFINHSCNPNCETTQDADGRIFIAALLDIAAGEELTYEYNLHDSDEDEAPCFCAAPNCRATMFSSPRTQAPCPHRPPQRCRRTPETLRPSCRSAHPRCSSAASPWRARAVCPA